MNDIGYTNIPFKGSITETSILHRLKTIEEYNYYKHHVEMAVDYHTKEKNPFQIQYFTSALALCNKQINKLLKRRIKL